MYDPIVVTRLARDCADQVAGLDVDAATAAISRSFGLVLAAVLGSGADAHTCPSCGSIFHAPSPLDPEHQGACPSCFDLVQILAFANSVGAPLNAKKTIRTIRIIALTRLDPNGVTDIGRQ